MAAAQKVKAGQFRFENLLRSRRVKKDSKKVKVLSMADAATEFARATTDPNDFPGSGYTNHGGIRNYHPNQKTTPVLSGVPLQWKSKPGQPEAQLAYITDAEKELLKQSNVHNKDAQGHARLMQEMNIGPHGILSLDDSGGAGGGGAGSGGGGGGGNDMGQDDTLGEDDQAAATAGDFGSSSGFGLSQAEAEAQARAANAAMADIANASSVVEDKYRFDQKSFLEKIASPVTWAGLNLGLNRAERAAASGLVGAMFGGVPGAVQGAALNAMSNPTSSFSNVGPMGAPSPVSSTPGPRDGGGDGGGNYYKQPSILNPVPGLAAPVAVAAAPQMPQYEFKRNWWEGNKFFPAPITRIN
jgi:hypothetical protein